MERVIKKIEQTRAIVFKLLDLKDVLKDDKYLLDNEVKSKIEESCWKLIQQINEMTSIETILKEKNETDGNN